MHGRVFSFPNDNILSSVLFRYTIQKGLFKAFFLLLGVIFLLFHSCYRADADSIKLKNGNILRGDIVSQDKDSVVIQLPYGRITVRRQTIKEITKEKKDKSCLHQADSLVRLGSYKRAIRLYRKAVSLGIPHKEAQKKIENAYIEWLEVLRTRKCYEAALDIGEKAVRDIPDSEQLQSILTDIRSRDNRIKKRLSRAAVYLDVGKYAEVLRLLDDVVQHNPYLADTAGIMVADAHYGLGEKALMMSDFDRAAARAKKAMLVHAKKTDVYMNLYLCAQTNRAVTALNKRDIPRFRSVAAEISAHAPQRPETFFFQAQLAEIDGDCGTALRMYNKMLPRVKKKGGQDVLTAARKEAIELFRKKRITSVRRFSKEVAAAGGKVCKHETQYFIVHGYNRRYLERVGMAAEFHLKNILERFTANMPEKMFTDKIVIRLFPDQKNFLENGAPGEWSSGLTKVLLSSARKQRFTIESFHGSSRFMQTILPHELGHAVLYRISPGKRIPLFLHEGVAVSNEPGLRHQYFKHLLRKYAAVDDLIPAQTLFKLKKYTSDPGRFYAQSYAVFDICRKRYGDRELMKKITALSARPTQTELLKLTGMSSFDALNKAITAWALSPE